MRSLKTFLICTNVHRIKKLHESNKNRYCQVSEEEPLLQLVEIQWFVSINSIMQRMLSDVNLLKGKEARQLPLKGLKRRDGIWLKEMQEIFCKLFEQGLQRATSLLD